MIEIPVGTPSAGALAATSGSVSYRTLGRDLGLAAPNPRSLSVGSAIKTSGLKK